MIGQSIETISSCLVGGIVWFLIGRYLLFRGKVDPRPSHVLAGLGAAAPFGLAYERGEATAFSLIALVIFWCFLLWNCWRLSKGGSA
jgi:hypothetical protein